MYVQNDLGHAKPRVFREDDNELRRPKRILQEVELMNGRYANIILCGLVGLVCAACEPAPSADLLDKPVVDRLEQGMAEGDESFEHETYDALLSAHVDEEEGTVDYGGLAEQEAKLDAYLSEVADADLAELSGDAQLALLINAYNAYTLKLILEQYPEIDSIRDIDEPWSTVRWEVGGQKLSLDQIEHGLIRPLYQDPRIHFAVNCAAVDCPHLAESAYKGAEIDEQLEARARATLSDDKFVRIEDGELRYTKVIHWYQNDFVDPSFQNHAESVPVYIARYTRDEVRKFIEDHDGTPPSSPLSYDWALNDEK
jgi:hypothetical protein